jgi:hypothetical protein
VSVYYVLAPDLGLVKIGFAAEPKARFSKIQSDSPVRLVLMGFEDGDEAVEASRHIAFAEHRHRGEWFRLDGLLSDHVAALAPIPLKPLSMNKRLVECGISKTYASMILSGKQKPCRPLAIHIFRKTGWRHESIADLTDQHMTMLEQIEPWTPRADAPPAPTEQQAA